MDQLNEEIRRLKEIMGIDEMAYPADFNFEEFRNIRSFAGRINYAKQKLLGKLGAGSARAVFRIDEEKVLKVALNRNGLVQNEAESDWGAQNYDIVAKVFEYDEENTWLEMELAKKVSPKRFEELTGVMLDELIAWLSYIDGYNMDVTKEAQNRMRNNEFVTNLTMFAQDYGYPVPGDFAKISSYGEVLRDGIPTIVLLDFGFNSNTHDVYLAARNKSRAKYGLSPLR